MYYKKKKHKNKGGGGSCNSRQKRKEKTRKGISETQRLAIVNAVLSKKRLVIYSDNL
jgi:hypothetical protein